MTKRRKSRLNKKTVLPLGLVKCPQHDKVLHRELEQAEKAAKGYRKKWGSKMCIYECRYWIGWHIGHTRAHRGRKSGKLKGLFPRIKD